MKRVLVYRHAKTEKAQGRMPDFERELTAHGTDQARSIGRALAAAALRPELVITSDAVRAVQTAELTRDEAGFNVEIRLQEELYGADAAEYLSILREQDDTYATIMIVGHNPAIEDLLGMLTGGEVTMKTGWVAVLDAPIDAWEDFADGADVTIAQTVQPEP